MKPKITMRFQNPYRRDGWLYREEVTIQLNGKTIAEGGYGGEPEDNNRYRDYQWVEVAIQKVAEALGAEVEIIEE